MWWPNKDSSCPTTSLNLSEISFFAANSGGPTIIECIICLKDVQPIHQHHIVLCNLQVNLHILFRAPKDVKFNNIKYIILVYIRLI